jgi:hypothetical protein
LEKNLGFRNMQEKLEKVLYSPLLTQVHNTFAIQNSFLRNKLEISKHSYINAPDLFQVQT